MTNKKRITSLLCKPAEETTAKNLLSIASDMYPKKIKIGCFVNEKTDITKKLEELKSIKNPPMWAHYGDNFNGVAIVFDKDKLIEACKEVVEYDWACYANIVDYNEIRQKNYSLWNNIDLSKQIIDLEIKKQYFNNISDFWFNKNSKWSYEDEFRIMLYSNDIYPIEVNILQSLKAIVFGERVSRFLIEALLPKLKSLNIDCLQITFDTNKNKFICKKIKT